MAKKKQIPKKPQFLPDEKKEKAEKMTFDEVIKRGVRVKLPKDE